MQGAPGAGSMCAWMSELIGGLQAFEDELILLIRELYREQETQTPTEPAEATALSDTL